LKELPATKPQTLRTILHDSWIRDFRSDASDVISSHSYDIRILHAIVAAAIARCAPRTAAIQPDGSLRRPANFSWELFRKKKGLDALARVFAARRLLRRRGEFTLNCCSLFSLISVARKTTC
jgi:hypothetical protein